MTLDHAVLNFNPRSREGSDAFRLPLRQGLRISIHAPVKGATREEDAERKAELISIHAPVKGATRITLVVKPHLPDFNPRSREGSDARPSGPGAGHADFNPRSREGSDVGLETTMRWYRYFNPRSREGSDLRSYRYQLPLSISIHAPVKGATALGINSLPFKAISIHAPVKGATAQ